MNGTVRPTADALMRGPAHRPIRALAQDCPRVWQRPHLPARERQRLGRLLLEDVTLRKHTRVAGHLRLRGERTHSLTLPLAKRSWQLRQTAPAVMAESDRLREDHTDAAVAARLNAADRRPGMGGFHRRLIARLRKDDGLPSRYERLRARGLLTQREMAERLGIDPTTVPHWRRQDRLIGYAHSDKPAYLYEDPGEARPLKYRWQRERTHPQASAPPLVHSSSNVR
jgi:hypothetical protein